MLFLFIQHTGVVSVQHPQSGSKKKAKPRRKEDKMKDIMKVSTVAFNAKWGDKEANLNRMAGYIEAAAAEGSNLIVFPRWG